MESTNQNKRFSVMERPRETTTSRRRATPGKNTAAASQQAVPPKPKFTAEQQLKILERLEKRDFLKGAGLAQFYESPQPNNPELARKNLLKEFDSTKSERATGNPLFSSTGIPGSSEDEMSALMERCMQTEENYSELPSYIKSMDKLFTYYMGIQKMSTTISELKVKARFQRQFPKQDIITFFTKMDKVAALMDRFVKKPMLERAQLFQGQKGFPKKEDKARQIQCDVRDHAKVIVAINQISTIMGKLETVVRKIEDPNLFNKIDTVIDMLDELEGKLHLMNELQNEKQDLLDKELDIEYLEDKDSDANTTSTENSSLSSPSP